MTDTSNTETTGTPPAAPAPAAGQPTAPQAPTRPDFLPERFWDPQAGAPRVEDMAKSYTALERRLMTKTEALREEIRKEQDTARVAKRPASKEEYAVEAEKLKLPEGVGFKFQEDHPLLQFWREHAWESGMDNDAFLAGVQRYVDAELANMPDPKKEVEILGENGVARIGRVENWLKSNISKESFEIAKGFVNSAAGVVLMEEIMAKAGEPRFGSDNAGGNANAAKSRADLQKMMADPRYQDPRKRDKEYVAMVDAEYAKAFPGNRTMGYSTN